MNSESTPVNDAIQPEPGDQPPMVHLVVVGEYEETRVIAAFADVEDAAEYVRIHSPEWSQKDLRPELGGAVPYFGPQTPH